MENKTSIFKRNVISNIAKAGRDNGITFGHPTMSLFPKFNMADFLLQINVSINSGQRKWLGPFNVINFSSRSNSAWKHIRVWWAVEHVLCGGRTGWGDTSVQLLDPPGAHLLHAQVLPGRTATHACPGDHPGEVRDKVWRHHLPSRGLADSFSQGSLCMFARFIRVCRSGVIINWYCGAIFWVNKY